MQNHLAASGNKWRLNLTKRKSSLRQISKAPSNAARRAPGDEGGQAPPTCGAERQRHRSGQSFHTPSDVQRRRWDMQARRGEPRCAPSGGHWATSKGRLCLLNTLVSIRLCKFWLLRKMQWEQSAWVWEVALSGGSWSPTRGWTTDHTKGEQLQGSLRGGGSPSQRAPPTWLAGKAGIWGRAVRWQLPPQPQWTPLGHPPGRKLGKWGQRPRFSCFG